LTTVCPDWERRVIAGESLTPPPIYPIEAEAALAVFRELRIVDAPGSPRMGDACKPWILDFVASVFGAYDAETGRRMMTEWLLSVSKKNFKSGLAAGIMLTALIRNWRESAEYGILAPTIEVANNSFFPARDMVRKDEELSDLFLVQDHIRTITHRNSGATLKVIAAENEAVGGKKFTGVLVDELWLFGKRSKSEDMFREATGGLASRPEGFAIYLTTMSNEAPAGIFKQKLDYARGVRDGRINDPKFVPVLYEFPESMLKEKAYLDPEKFYITNPNLNASVDIEFLQREMGKAQEAGAESLIGFQAKHLNVEIGLALRSDRWAGAEFWEACSGPKIDLELLLERSDVVDIGIDGGGLDDLLALTVLGRDAVTGIWLHWCRAWAHPSVLERRKSEAARLRDFEQDGDLFVVGKIGDDVDHLVQLVFQVFESGLLGKIGVDPHGIGAILDALEEAGVTKDHIVGVSQGWKLTGAIKTLERRLAERALQHSGSPLMAWAVGNAKVEPRGNAVIITKQAAGTAKIDPLISTLNAVTLMQMNPSLANKYQILFV
jgi:phage terminase large subunit-like protein